MSDFNKEKAEAFAMALRLMADKIEEGYPIEEQQEKLIVKLFRGFESQSQEPKYKASTARLQPKRLIYEDEEEEL